MFYKFQGLYFTTKNTTITITVTTVVWLSFYNAMTQLKGFEMF